MTSPRFKEIPEVISFEIPFKLKEELLLSWLLELSSLPSRDACEWLLRFLQVFNKTHVAAKTRIAYLKNSHEYLKKYISRLEGACWDVSLPLSEKELDYAKAVAWNYQVLGEGFFIAAQELATRTDEMFALSMSCHCLRQAQLHIASVYNSPNRSFWQLTYKVFAWVEKYKLSELKMTDSKSKDITLNTLLAEIFVFQISDTTQFRPRDIQTIFNFLPTVCNDFAVYKLADIKFQTHFLNVSYPNALANRVSNSAGKLADLIEKKVNSSQNDLFVFDLNQAASPFIINPTYSFATPSLRYFSALSVVENIEQILRKGEVWRGVLKPINTELFKRIVKTLTHETKRRDTRTKTEQNRLAVIGFESIVGFLYKICSKNKIAQIQASLNRPSIYEALKKYAGETKYQLEVIDDGFFELDFEQPLKLDSPWSNKTEADITQNSVVLKKLVIFDSSESGYSVHWEDNQNSKAKVGDIFGIISQDKKRLEIAIIRRIIMDGHYDYKFGTEVLGFKSELVMIRLVDNQSTGRWGIFIPGIESLNRADSLLYAIGHFQEGDFVCIYTSTKTVKAGLKKGLNATAAVVHIELDYVAPTLMDV